MTMTELFEFDLDVDTEPVQKISTKAATELEKWADEQLAKPFGPLFFDIETGPFPEERLRAAYHEKTLEDFAATCDKRWKPDTVAAKYEEYRSGAWEEFVGKAALSAVTGRVLLIGLVQDGEFVGLVDSDEATNLRAFWELAENALAAKRRIIGHNSNGFDVPFLVRRSWLLGVTVPREVRQGRYWNPLFLDTMDVWSFGAREFIRLNDIARFFGVGQKTEGVEGRDFHRLWFGTMPAEEWGTPEEQRTKALEYCEQDVRLTAAIAAKMGIV